MNSPNKSATISVADFLFLPFFQTPLIPNSRYFNNLEHSHRVAGAGIYDMPDGKKVCSKSKFVLENCGKMPNIAN